MVICGRCTSISEPTTFEGTVNGDCSCYDGASAADGHVGGDVVVLAGGAVPHKQGLVVIPGVVGLLEAKIAVAAFSDTVGVAATISGRRGAYTVRDGGDRYRWVRGSEEVQLVHKGVVRVGSQAEQTVERWLASATTVSGSSGDSLQFPAPAAVCDPLSPRDSTRNRRTTASEPPLTAAPFVVDRSSGMCWPAPSHGRWRRHSSIRLTP